MTASSSPAPKPNPRPVPSAAAPVDPVNATPEPVEQAGEPSVGQLVSDASTHLSTLIRGEIELAKLELRSTVKNAGVGAIAFAAAAVLAVFSLIYFFQAIAETFDRYLVPRWVAFFIVFGLLLLGAGLLVYFGVRKVKRVKAPAQTMRTARETVDYLKKSRG